MNATIKTFTAILAAGFPAAYLAESYGINLPDAINSAHAFGAFVVAVTILTMMADYRPQKSLVAVSAAAEPARVPAANAKSDYRLAA